MKLCERGLFHASTTDCAEFGRYLENFVHLLVNTHGYAQKFCDFVKSRISKSFCASQRAILCMAIEAYCIVFLDEGLAVTAH